MNDVIVILCHAPAYHWPRNRPSCQHEGLQLHCLTVERLNKLQIPICNAAQQTMPRLLSENLKILAQVPADAHYVTRLSDLGPPAQLDQVGRGPLYFLREFFIISPKRIFHRGLNSPPRSLTGEVGSPPPPETGVLCI